MNKIKLVITLVLVLLVGIFAGSLGTRIYLKHQLEGSRTARSHSSEERIQKMLKGLTDDLHLDAKQQTEIEKILVVTDAKATGVRAMYQPDMKKIYDRGFELIKEKLNDEQKARLNSRREKSAGRYNSYYFRSLRTAQKGIPDVNTLKDRLGLDGAQYARVRTILADQKNRQDFIIARYEKFENPDLAAVNSELAEVRKTTGKQLAEILTPEQLARYGEERHDLLFR